jgi:hypothetical protein
MRTMKLLAVLTALVLMGQSASCLAADAEEGLALAIVYDTSGSMKDPVADEHGGRTPKYVIANRSLIAIARRIQAYATNTPTGSPRRVDTVLFVFKGEGVRQAVRFGPFAAKPIELWAERFSSPGGNTPLGNALAAAAHCVMNSSLTRRHVLVLTDGINTAGAEPSRVLPKLEEEAQRQHKAFSVHFVAFDVEAKRFDRLKKLGVTVVGAADERQLHSQIDFILERKILLEEEEPKPTH